MALSRDELYLEVERLTDKVEAKFQYILDLQGKTIDLNGPDVVPNLVHVVNAHGVVVADMVRYLRKLTAVVSELMDESESSR